MGAATADLFPKFSLTGIAGLQSVSASDWLSRGSRFWSIGPTISWPVFDAGRIRATIEIRNAQQEQALTQYEKSILSAFQDVETALVNYANEQVRYRSLTDAVAANRRAVTMANELYIRGLNDFLNVSIPSARFTSRRAHSHRARRRWPPISLLCIKPSAVVGNRRDLAWKFKVPGSKFNVGKFVPDVPIVQAVQNV